VTQALLTYRHRGAPALTEASEIPVGEAISGVDPLQAASKTSARQSMGTVLASFRAPPQ